MGPRRTSIGDDPFNIDSPPDSRWTTANTGEQMPGVLTPLTITLTMEPAELGLLRAFALLGVIPRSEVRMPEHRHDHSLGYFYGRCAANVSLIRRLFDLTPGTSGAAYEAQMFGGEGLGESELLRRRRWPLVAAQMPWRVLRTPTGLTALRAELQEWWAGQVRRMPTATLPEARQAALDAQAQMQRVTPYVYLATLTAQLAYGRICALSALAGHPGLENTISGGYGTEELEMANDFWAVSRGTMPGERFFERHGWTAPMGMELSARSWRETPELIEPLLRSYRELPDEDDPRRVSEERAAERRQAEIQLLRGLPRRRRVEARLLLRLTAEYMRLRTVQKACSAIVYDGMRLGARRIGVLLHADGLIDDPDDAFYLTQSELLAPELPADARERIATRRAARDEYQALRLPDGWTGNPVPIVVADVPRAGSAGSAAVSGTGVSPGIVEGPVRVVTSPTDGDVRPGEILVCEMTDPSWISLMVVAAGFVIDIGGPVSHGAIIARELGIPCVINTGSGTAALRTGQRVRIDGSTGTVEVLGEPDEVAVPLADAPRPEPVR
ncbi:PEP-utilizing enzyme [Patulibacter sp. NPDC049589]|uniref:PEP-utilizing enzyme n=1 Tax=Patulibacter sp. NPDC049589 TaxID=3154731 RepID=UPI0034375F2B